MNDFTERLGVLLTERDATSDCPACNHEDWIHFGELINLVVHPTTGTEHQQPIDTRVLPAYVLICGNCGYIRLHSREVLNSDPNDDD